MKNKTSMKLIWSPSATPQLLHAPLRTLAETFALSESDTGANVRFVQTNDPNSLRVCAEANIFTIDYGSTSGALRGVAHALADRSADETTSFTMLGIMLDCSRGAVMSLPYLKKWLRQLALLGYNTLMLYTEDTYELPGEPYFGYMRGSYSMAEIKELDAYAATLGMDIIACIQTLGHMEQILKWEAFRDVADTEFVLLAGAKETYTFIEKMITFWSEALRSRRIHIGMDEASDMGCGKYIRRFGYEPQFDIFNRHLGRVNDMCHNHGLQPMIWSDMYFKMGSPTHTYCDPKTVIPESIKTAIPEGVDLVYWDYYTEDEAFYAEWIRRHRDLKGEPMMASGIMTWARFWYDHAKTVRGVTPCVRACQKQNVKELLFTLWGDGGGSCEFDSAWTGLTWAADLAFGGDGAPEQVSPMFTAVCNGDYATQLIPGKLQAWLENPRLEVKTSTMLWDDPLLGIGWTEYLVTEPTCWERTLKHLEALYAELEPLDGSAGPGNIDHGRNLCRLLIAKLKFRTALVAAYAQRNRAALKRLAKEGVPEILTALQAFTQSFRCQWLRRNKAFGMEVIQIRLAAQLVRYEETATRINELLEGKIETIEELDVIIQPREKSQHVGFFDWLATGSLRV